MARVTLFLFVVLKHREVDHPQETPIAGLDQVEPARAISSRNSPEASSRLCMPRGPRRCDFTPGAKPGLPAAASGRCASDEPPARPATFARGDCTLGVADFQIGQPVRRPASWSCPGACPSWLRETVPQPGTRKALSGCATCTVSTASAGRLRRFHSRPQRKSGLSEP